MTRHTQRNLIFSGVAIVVTALVCLAVIFGRNSRQKFTVKTYLANGQNLRSGAEVWIDGIRAGSITAVYIRPEQKHHPVEVIMAINKPYQSVIPSDSIAVLSSQGILSPKGIEIDTRESKGPLIQNGGVLISQEVSDGEPVDALKIFETLNGVQKKLTSESRKK